MWRKLIKFSIYGLVFLMPLFWLPFSFEAFEFNKGYLLFFLVSIGILAWFGKMIFQDKEIRFRRTPIDLYVLGFLAIMVFSVLLSQDKISSLLGFYGMFWPSLVGILSLGGFYFLVTNNVGITNPGNRETDTKQNTKQTRNSFASVSQKVSGQFSVNTLIKVFLWSAFLVVSVAYLSLFGVWARMENVIPGNFQFPQLVKLQIFNTIGGSFEQLSIFLAFISVLLIGILAFHQKGGRKFGFYILLFAILVLLALIDFWAGWLVIFLALLFFLGFAFWKRIFREDVGRLSLSIFFLLISLIFLLFNPLQNVLSQDSTLRNLPSEILLDQGTSWRVSWQGFKEHPVIGGGLGNFSYTFSKFKPASFLESDFWQIRFNRAGNHIAEILGTTGILGFLSYFLMIGMFLIISLVIITTEKLTGGRPLQLPLLLGFIALVIGQFVFYQNTTLAFSFWLFLGLAVASWQQPRETDTKQDAKQTRNEKVFAFKDFPEVGLIFNAIFWVVLIGFAFLYFNFGKYYLADIYYKDYLQNPQKIEKLEKASQLAARRTTYHIVLARAYLQKFAEEASKPQPDNQVIGNMVALAVQEAKKAADLSPNRVASQETSGVVYRGIQGVAQGALEWGIKSFEKALELEPKNPVLLTELGKLQVTNNDFGRARDLFNQALGQRPDFVDAAIQLSILDEGEGKTGEAISRLEDLVRNNPFLVEAHFQLGRLYYNQKEYDKAIDQFQSAITLFPSHSNSHYSLGLIYERQGEKEKALREFERVLELNPGNEDVMRKIEELKR